LDTVVVIPSRYGSTRFPGKPLIPVAGVAVVERVWRIARTALPDVPVVIATDDDRIAAFCRGIGAQVVMTPVECKNGTERCLAAAQALPTLPRAVINLQGDAVLTPPWVLQAVLHGLKDHPNAAIVTPAAPLTGEAKAAFLTHKKTSPSSGTTVVFDNTGKALYFSKAILPNERTPKPDTPIWQHIGLYGYRTAALQQLCALEESPLEATEQLEQLRALENGLPAQVVPVDLRGHRLASIDTPADVTAAEGILASLSA
jgi:3-deoxy-manno-octulosonate cytidylyltransferase (CMP-KDO synthetase)